MGTTAPTKLSQQQRDELRASLIILSEVCAVDICNPEDCPFYEVRKMEHSQRLNWFNALTDDDLAYIAAHHHIFFNLKMAQKSAEENFLPDASLNEDCGVY